MKLMSKISQIWLEIGGHFELIESGIGQPSRLRAAAGRFQCSRTAGRRQRECADGAIRQNWKTASY